MSEEEFGINLNRGRATNRLTLDSQQDQRIEEQQQRQIQQMRIKKQQKQKQKKRRRQQYQEDHPEKQKQDLQLNSKQININFFEEDSNSRADFERAKRKIKKFYPNFHQPKSKQQHKKPKKRQLTPQQSQVSQSEQSQIHHKNSHKKAQKIKKIQKKSQKKKPSNSSHRQHQTKVKRQDQSFKSSTKKDLLLKQLAVRWQYALPEWPPQDFDYEGQLKKLGFRSVDASLFKQEDEVVNGLHKVCQVDGFKGVYKSKYRLIDVRQKQNAPSLEYFASKSESQLVKLLIIALKEQIQQLKNVKHQQSGQKQLLIELQRKLSRLEG